MLPPSANCANCVSKLKRLASENAKLRSKLQEVSGRRDHYAKLYYEAVAELEQYKHKTYRPSVGEQGQGGARKNGFKDSESFPRGPYDHSKQGVPIYRTKTPS